MYKKGDTIYLVDYPILKIIKASVIDHFNESKIPGKGIVKISFLNDKIPYYYHNYHNDKIPYYYHEEFVFKILKEANNYINLENLRNILYV